MGLSKSKSNGTHTVVTFKIDEQNAPGGSGVLLLGDFNNWKIYDTSCQMEKRSGSYIKTIELKNGKRYEFRYLSEERFWFNDEAADDYVPSPFHGIDNSVVDLTNVPVKAKAKPKKAEPKAKKAEPKAKAVKTVKAVKAVKDDLTKIEGIGPKIAGLLAADKIETFEKLGSTSVAALEKILKNAGPRYAIHKPGSWPKQAKLAAKGNWDELKRLQEELTGGK